MNGLGLMSLGRGYVGRDEAGDCAHVVGFLEFRWKHMEDARHHAKYGHEEMMHHITFYVK